MNMSFNSVTRNIGQSTLISPGNRSSLEQKNCNIFFAERGYSLPIDNIKGLMSEWQINVKCIFVSV